MTEHELAEWLIRQIKAYDAGQLTPRQVAELDLVWPEWRSDDTRFHYLLVDDWTEDRMAAYLGSRIAAYDAGRLPKDIEEMLDRVMRDWRSDETRVYCG